jgi:TonB family protein
MPAYDGDWIMWFADQESKLGETPLVRAPLPFRKVEPVAETPPGGRTEERIQVAGTLRKNGKLDGITLLTKASPAVERAVLQDVTSWEFQPATRNGVPVDVDVVLEIPFSLPTSIAKSTQP